MFKTSESTGKLSESLVKFQNEFNGISPDSVNPFFKSRYTSLDAIIGGTRKLLAKYGLAVLQFPVTSEDGIYCGSVSRLTHVSGEYMETTAIMFKPTKADPQGMGSAITYAKRYQMAALLGVCDEDDDANASSHTGGNNNQPTMITAEQRATVNSLITAKKLTKDQCIAICKQHTGKDTTANLTDKEADKLIAALKNTPANQ